MTDTSPTQPDDDEVGEALNIAVTLYPADGGEISLRQIALGLQPLVLVEVADDEETGVRVDITGSLVDDYEELLDRLQMAITCIEAALAQQEAGAISNALETSDEEGDRG